jgi:hypothetical protein
MSKLLLGDGVGGLSLKKELCPAISSFANFSRLRFCTWICFVQRLHCPRRTTQELQGLQRHTPESDVRLRSTEHHSRYFSP